MGDGRRGCKWGGTMGTNGSQAAARGAAFNLIVLRSNRDRDQWYSTVIQRVCGARNEWPISVETDGFALKIDAFSSPSPWFHLEVRATRE